jgi:hypothetical protein
MPIKSSKQLRLMLGVANSPSFANKVGIKQSIGKEMVSKTPKKKLKSLLKK